MNADSFKHKEITDIILRSFYEVYNEIGDGFEAQLINYLKATNIEVSLLLNFGKRPGFKRFIYDNKRKNISDDQRKSVAE
ncbi:MAG: GxxExxY protein [Desulfobacteraceae bacterium]|nr:GxxExxY protein [Desulfobacteraceae bacterium]